MSLINREDLLKKQCSYYDYNGEKIGVVRVSDIVEMPSEEPGRKHGRWLLGKFMPSGRKIYLPDVVYCSECQNMTYWDMDFGQQLFDYCPNCGANMWSMTNECEDKTD